MKKRIFISFAVEDSNLRDLLVGQSKNDDSPFEFVDMSVKEPWKTEWKTNCRTKIKGCDGLLAIITKNTKNADGQLWEIKCAKEESVPRRGIWGHNNDTNFPLPKELDELNIVKWNWENIKKWLESI